jgi:Family of unknown function (DUF6152)
MRFICSALALTAVTVAAHAHHSGAMYDLSKQITIEGTVARYDWANPHVYIYVEQIADDGRVIEWEVETLTPGAMRRQGWSADTLRVGDELVVTGNPARNVENSSLYPTLIQRADSTLYELMEGFKRLATANAADEAAASGLDGTWATLLTLDVVMRFAQPTLPLTDAGTAALASFDGHTMDPEVDCIPNAAPLFMIEPDIKRISTGNGLITIDGGWTKRTIHLDASTRVSASPSVQGHSTGRWEGSTLVIETSHFADHRTGNAYVGVPSGSMKELVERLALNEGGTSLSYSFELTDPEFLSAAVSGRVQWSHRPDLAFVPQECDLEIARRFIGE